MLLGYDTDHAPLCPRLLPTAVLLTSLMTQAATGYQAMVPIMLYQAMLYTKLWSMGHMSY